MKSNTIFTKTLNKVIEIGLEFCKKGLEVTILEKNPFVGGIATSIQNNGFSMDVGPHYVTFPKNSEITNEVIEMIGKENFEELPQNIRRSRKAYFHGKMWNEFPSINQFISQLGSKVIIQIIFELIKSQIKKTLARNHTTTTKEYLIANYGNYLYNNWFKLYYQNQFFDSIPTKEVAKKKFPPINLQKIFQTLSSRNESTKINNNSKEQDYFNCYFKGGMITLIKSLENKIKEYGGKIETSVDIKSIEHNNIKKEISYIKDGKSNLISSDVIIYALPLNIAQKWFHTKPGIIGNKQENIALNSIMVFLFVDSTKVFDKWIIDVYDKDLIFWRISQQSFLSNTVVTPNKSLLCIEIRTTENSPVWILDNNEIFDKVKADLVKSQILTEEKIEGYKIIKLRNIYPLNPERINDNSIRKMINSYVNEYAAGTELDIGILTSEYPEIDDNNSVRLGGVLNAMTNAKILVNSIIKKF